MRSPSEARSPRTVALVVLTLSIVLVGSVVNVAAGALRPTAPGGLAVAASAPPDPLASAAASLRAGAGPASGQSLTCASSGPGMMHCGGLAVAATPVSSAIPAPTSDVGTWANLSTLVSASPTGRVTTMAWDPIDGNVLLYGGASVRGTLGDTWTYSNGTWTNISGTVSGAPPRLALGGLAYDPSSREMIYFGGQNATSIPQAQTWAFHAKSWSNLTGTTGSAPSARDILGMVTDTTDGEILLYGGQNATYHFVGDTWTFKAGAWTNITSTAPIQGVVEVPMLSDDPADHGALLLGLQAWKSTPPYAYRTASFLFTAGSWHNLTSTLTLAPPLPYVGAMAYVPSAHAVVALIPAFVNSTGSPTFYSQTWEFSGGAWRNITVAVGFPPAIGVAPGCTVIPSDNAFLTFGGETYSGTPGFTWVLSAGPAVTVAGPSLGATDLGSSVSFTGSVVGGLSPVSMHWSFSDGGPNSTSLSVTHAFTATGIEKATLWATDDLGRTTSASASIFVNLALQVTPVVTPRAPVATEAAGFVAQVSGGTPPLTYAWNLGDGTTGANASASHTYASGGTYTVTLSVHDAAGSAVNSSLTLSVASAPSTGVSLSSGTGLGLLGAVIVLLVVAAVLAVLLLRRPKPPGPMTSYPAAMPGPPTAAPPTQAPSSSGGAPPPPP